MAQLGNDPRTQRAILPAAIALMFIYLSYLKYYLAYRPFGDDPAVLVASGGNPKLWFTEGFSRLFVVYPEWTVPFTDFLRVGVNLILLTSHVFFGSHYVYYFAALYLAQLTLCWLLIRTSASFGVSSRWLPYIGVIAVINPAFINRGLTSIADQFDVWCGLFVFLAFYLLLSRKYALALAVMTLAVFTKEAALFAPIAASLTLYLETRRRLVSLAMLIPLAIWGAVRKLVFVGSVGGLYAVPIHSGRAMIAGIAHGLLLWPSGILPSEAVRRIVLHHSMLDVLLPILAITLNLCLWVGLIFVSSAAFRKILSDKSPRKMSLKVLSIIIWLFGALSFGVLAGHDPRFGGAIYGFGILFIFVALSEVTFDPPSRPLRVAVAILLILFSVHGWQALRVDISSRESSMGALVDAIRFHANDAGTVLILNSADSYSAPRYVAALADVSTRIVILNQFGGCQNSETGVTVVDEFPGSIHVASTLPHCAEYLFDGVQPSVLASSVKGRLTRGSLAQYVFSDARLAESRLTDGLPSVDLGNHLTIDISTRGMSSHVLLYYDWTTGRYRCVGSRCSLG
jgi:hypothetical protein